MDSAQLINLRERLQKEHKWVEMYMTFKLDNQTIFHSKKISIRGMSEDGRNEARIFTISCLLCSYLLIL